MPRIIRLSEKLLKTDVHMNKAYSLDVPTNLTCKKPYLTLCYCELGEHFGAFEVFFFPITKIVPSHPNYLCRVLLFLKPIVNHHMNKSPVKVHSSGRKAL